MKFPTCGNLNYTHSRLGNHKMWKSGFFHTTRDLLPFEVSSRMWAAVASKCLTEIQHHKICSAGYLVGVSPWDIPHV